MQEPEQLIYQQRRFSLKEHQQEAFDDVINGFKVNARGKLIMACGTGKTFTALKIAEEIAGTEGRVLYLVPSISLLSQAMREWSEQRGIDHSYIGICSDTRAGSTSEDASIQELKIPVTTDPPTISRSLQNPDTGKMMVVFCTYHSLPIVEGAQQDGAPPFDIIFCDEAHRTTGVEHPDDRTSPFVLVHNTDRIRANKRLYMTATPRIYTETARAHARNYERDVFSMDDANTYGPEFHRLPFSKAVEIDELSDYKVVVLAISEGEINTALRGDSVRRRARGIDNSAGRQKVLLELYENFFVTALKKEADRLGIVYTPIEVVDFILQSANEVLQDEFGRSLSDEGVHVLDPFTGTGTFLARLLQSEDLIQPHDLERKYRKELHANELVLLAYYIAAVNIEETFRGRRGEDTIYEPFSGIVLTDTFNLNKAEKPTIFPKE